MTKPRPPVLARPVWLALALVVASAGLARAQDDDDTPSLDDTPHITIVGRAATEVAPDLATITLGVTNQKPNAKAAADATSAAAQAIVDAAKAQGVKAADIATQAVNLAQTFEDQRDGQGRDTGRKSTGFEASNTISIRIRDLSKAGTLAQSLIDKGANTFDGIAFSVERPQPILDRLAAEAVAAARRQAEMVAQAGGVKLGRVLLIERPGEGPARGPVFAAPMRMAAVAQTSMPVEAGVERLAAEMEVTWAIDPR